MTERERIIEIIQKSVDGCAEYWAGEIADGLLDNGVTVLPCKVGDKVYQRDNVGRIYEHEIKKIVYDTGLIAFDESAIGKTVFLTREEAKIPLKKLEAKLEKIRKIKSYGTPPFDEADPYYEREPWQKFGGISSGICMAWGWFRDGVILEKTTDEDIEKALKERGNK